MGRPTDPTHGSLPGGRRKKGLQTDLQEELGQEIETLLGRQCLSRLDLEALENGAKRVALRLVAEIVEQKLNANHSDDQGPWAQCACQQQARYAGRKSKIFLSVLGPLCLQRAYYHCSACQHGFYPRDQAWGLEARSLSPGVIRMVSAVGAAVSFEEGSQLLKELADLTVDPKQVQRTAEAIGQAIDRDEHLNSEALSADDPPPTMYLGIDGTGVPLRRQELQGRPGKQGDGSAKTREVKLCVVWSAESRDEEDRPVRDAGSVSYSAAIESAAAQETQPIPSEFYQRVVREATRRGLVKALRLAVLGDGASWIWNLADELYPGAVQIVDLWHAKEYFSVVGKELYGAGSKKATAWIQRRWDELDEGRFDALLRAVARHAGHNEEARKLRERLKVNRHRMDYPRFKREGLCTSSGVVEAGCKVVIGTRLKRAGMHWSVPGANAITALRCCRLSGRFQDFWERRSELPKAA
jgi:hypothetical protein